MSKPKIPLAKNPMADYLIEDYPILLSEIESYLMSKYGEEGRRLADSIHRNTEPLTRRGAIALVEGDLRISQTFLRHFEGSRAQRSTSTDIAEREAKRRADEARAREQYQSRIDGLRAYKPRACRTGERVADGLAKETQGLRKIQCRTGRIDVLTETEVIAVGELVQWKEALGQVKVHGLEYPGHGQRIHLYTRHGGSDHAELQLAESVCALLDVRVTH